MTKNIKIYHKIAICSLAILVALLPSLKLSSGLYTVFVSFFFCLLCIICVFLLPIRIHIKIMVVLVLLALYKTAIKLSCGIIFKILDTRFIHSIKNRKNNDDLREYIRELFSENFRLHTELDKIPDEPCIIVSNYCKDRIENMAYLLLPGNVAITIGRGPRTIHLCKMVKWTLYTEKSGNYQKTKEQTMGHILQGNHVFCYITRVNFMEPNQFISMRSGMFNIAKELNVMIVPVLFDYVDSYMGYIPYQNFRLIAGEPFKVNNVRQDMKKVLNFFKEKMTYCMKTKYENLE